MLTRYILISWIASNWRTHERRQLAFSNATVYIRKLEADFWLKMANKATVAHDQKQYFDAAALVLSPVPKAGKLKSFEYGHNLFPGITPNASPGHTPGHTFYSVESKGKK